MKTHIRRFPKIKQGLNKPFNVITAPVRRWIPAQGFTLVQTGVGMTTSSYLFFGIRLILFFAFMLLLSGCSILNKEPDVVIGGLDAETPFTAGVAGHVTCSDLCEKKSQCGTTDGNKVIMGGIEAPVVSGWNMMLANETAVIINTSQSRTVQKTNDPSQEENIFFYHVTANDGSNKSGWIAGWCVASTAQPEPAAK